MKQLHRDLKDIPAKSVDDPDLYGYNDVLPHEKMLMRQVSTHVKHKHIRQMQQVIHNDTKHKHIVTVSTTQAKCYNVVKDYLKHTNLDKVSIKTIKSIYLESTIKALIKLNLFKIEGDYIKLGTYFETDVEIMEKGGVGKIMISMGMK